jgi:hypothetical protein
MFSSPFATTMTQSSSFSLVKAPASFCNAKQHKHKHQRKEIKRHFCVPVSSTILVKETNDEEASKPTRTRRRDAVLLATSAVFYALPSFAFGGGKKEARPDRGEEREESCHFGCRESESGRASRETTSDIARRGRNSKEGVTIGGVF